MLAAKKKAKAYEQEMREYEIKQFGREADVVKRSVYGIGIVPLAYYAIFLN